MLKNLVITYVVLIFSGCESGKNQSDQINAIAAPNLFDGNWYSSKNDTYLVISDGDVSSLRCSVFSGYVPLEGVMLTLEGTGVRSVSEYGEEYVSLDIEDGLLVVSNGLDEPRLEPAGEIPQYCIGDAVDITYASPTEVVAGEQTEILVNFDYRLASDLPASIDIGFSNGDPGSRTIYGEPIVLSAKGEGSDSFTVVLTPQIFDNGMPFVVTVSMDPTVETGETFSPYARDSIILSVTD